MAFALFPRFSRDSEAYKAFGRFPRFSRYSRDSIVARNEVVKLITDLGKLHTEQQHSSPKEASRTLARLRTVSRLLEIPESDWKPTVSATDWNRFKLVACDPEAKPGEIRSIANSAILRPDRNLLSASEVTTALDNLALGLFQQSGDELSPNLSRSIGTWERGLAVQKLVRFDFPRLKPTVHRRDLAKLKQVACDSGTTPNQIRRVARATIFRPNTP